MSNTCFLPDEAATEAFGALLATACTGRGLITLRGNLGAGKTTLCRGLIRALGHNGNVKSPTFTLVEPYEIGQSSIFHYDLYRLGDPEELEYLGIREQLDGSSLVLVEWPEKGGALLAAPDLALELALQGSGRVINWTAATDFGAEIVKKLGHDPGI